MAILAKYSGGGNAQAFNSYSLSKFINKIFYLLKHLIRLRERTKIKQGIP